MSGNRVAIVSLVMLLPLGMAGRAQTQAPAGPKSGAADVQRLTLTGCLQAAPDGKGFTLTDIRPSSAGTTDSSLTSAGAGTSATGATPSGSVSGETPTGSTATTTSAPTPTAGEAGTSANPASPTYNQGDVTAGTAGTVPRPEDAKASPVRTYQVIAAQGLNLKAHVGHTMELQGTLEPTSATPPGETTARESRGSATAEPTSDMREPVIEATRVRHVAAGCK